MHRLGYILPYQFRLITWTGGETLKGKFSQLTRLERALVCQRFREQASEFLSFWTPANTVLEDMRSFWRFARYSVAATLETRDGQRAYCENILTRSKMLRDWVGSKNSYHPKDLPSHIVPPTVDELSRCEVYMFLEYPPRTAYTAYLSTDCKRVTTWADETLAEIVWSSQPYRPNIGGQRVPIRAKGINGVMYYGRHNGPGACFNIRAYKSQTKKVAP